MKIETKFGILFTSIIAISLIVTFMSSYFTFLNFTIKELEKSYLESVNITSKILSNFNEINNENLFNYLGSLNHGYYYIVDNSGNVIFHSDKTKIGLNLNDVGLKNLYNYFLNNDNGVYEYSYEKLKRYAAFSKFEINGKTYFLVHALSEDELFFDLKIFKTYIYIAYIIIILISVIISLYLFNKFSAIFKNHIKRIQEFTTNVSANIAESSSASSEIESVANNTRQNIQKLDELVQNFSSSIEEGRSELNATLLNMKEFFGNIQTMNQMTMKIAEFINKLTALNEKIKDISDTVSILSINSSIETSKEVIDKEGISKIAELINDLASEARETSRNSEKVIKDIENNITSNVLLSEKISKELINVENSLDSISQVVESFADSVETLSNFSHTTNISMEEVLEGIKQTSLALSDISNSLNKLVNIARNSVD
ncbi:hypothetical protein JCM30566_06700 [Marinitoga arctica]